MECSEKPAWNQYILNRLAELSICPPDEPVRQNVFDHWDHVAKPIDGLGTFEHVIAQIGAISGTDKIQISKRAVLIFCADNGIVEEGISQSGQEVTAIVAEKMAVRQSSVGKMSDVIGMDTIPVDVGINRPIPIPGVLDKKVRCGTRNFMKEPAMTEKEAMRAIFTGIDLVRECKEQGYQILAAGEMGIGNTTTSSALAASLLGLGAGEVTGRGAGLNDKKLDKKIRIIDLALETYGLKYKVTGDLGSSLQENETDSARNHAFHALVSVGGLDIAGLAGLCIGGALYHIPVVLDGVISLTAALLAERLVPGTRSFLIASHVGKEPASEKLLEALELDAVINAGLALGEGTGAVMMMGLLDMALNVYYSQTTFSDMKIEPYERYEKR